MKENIGQTVKRELHFESSGETISVEIAIKNVSPLRKNEVCNFLDQLYQDTKNAIL